LNVQYCGDRNMDEGEECDDGNREDEDGCSKYCKKEVWVWM
jgi:cysteine-rich repeat protein